MRNTGTLSCLLLCFLILPRTSAQKSTQFALIDSLMSDYHSRGQFNGNILVAVRGDIIYHQSWGYADLDHHTSLDTSRIFCLASISKVYTATALMCLEEEGKVSLKDKVIQYLPELPEDPYGQITVRQLLSHTSGLPEQPGGWQARIDQENRDILEFLKKQERLDFEPGTRYAYSNNGFILLAEMVERLSGMSFAAFLKQRLFDRAGMKDSYVRYKNIQAPPELVKSYVNGQQADWPLHTYGPGGVYSTTGDLWRWDQAFFQGKIVKPATLDKMLRAISVEGKEKNYGLGWGILKRDGEISVGHTGGMFGFRTLYEHQLHSGKVIILLANMGDPSALMQIRNSVDALLNKKACPNERASQRIEGPAKI